jgi:hypothetical protein
MPMRSKLQAADTPDAITRPPVVPSEPAANPVNQSHSALGSLLVRLVDPRPIISRPRTPIRIRLRKLCALIGTTFTTREPHAIDASVLRVSCTSLNSLCFRDSVVLCNDKLTALPAAVEDVRSHRIEATCPQSAVLAQGSERSVSCSAFSREPSTVRNWVWLRAGQRRKAAPRSRCSSTAQCLGAC